MLSTVSPDTLTKVIGSLLIFGVPGYFQYRAVRDLRAEITIARNRGKFRGYLIGLFGIIAFAALVQILYVLSVLEVDPPRWSGLLVCFTIGLIMIGFLVGNRIVRKVRKKRRL